MSIYTVHEPPTRTAATDPQRFRFVRDGFHVWAFLLTPLWLLWNRLWVAFALYVGVVATVAAALWALGVASGARGLAVGLVSLLAGLEASTLQRWTLRRAGWNDVGVVAAHDLEAAERRFFDSWVTRGSPVPVSALSNVRASRPEEVIGLFPEPGTHR